MTAPTVEVAFMGWTGKISSQEKGGQQVDRLMGDARASQLYDVPLALPDAQAAVELTIEVYPGALVAVEYTGVVTRLRHGFFRRSTSTIVLNKIGENLGSVLHELAHAYSMGLHGRDYRDWHTRLLDLWE